MTALIEIACKKVIQDRKPTVRDLIQYIDENHEQADIPVEYWFSNGFYWREIVMPSGMVGAGHVHKHRHLNFALSGKAIVTCDGEIQAIEAPFVFYSEPGAQKAFQVIEEMRWLTRHEIPEELMGADHRLIEEYIFDLPQENKSSNMDVNTFRMSKKPKYLCQD